MRERSLREMRALADLMDRRWTGPFGFRFGLDGLIGLIPVVGDMITNAISVYVILRAAQLGVAPSVLVRMGYNLLVENLVDIIPFFGNLFDFVWKANSKNMKLVDQYFTNPGAVRRGSRALLGFVFVFILVMVAACVALSAFAVVWLVDKL